VRTAAPGTDVPFVTGLAGHGGSPALLHRGGRLTYEQLAADVERAADELGPGRRLVAVPGSSTVESLRWYLAALHAGHPVLLVPGDDVARAADLVQAWDPDVVITPDTGGWRPVRAARRLRARLHPDLALLLSTSGSTGSPKLVRLSHENLQSNATAIAEYLGLSAQDRAITTLPLHYCYGLSVVHSHLAVGASVVLTDRSVVDPCFWETFRATGATNLAGVPHTFELLDRVGFGATPVPSLRFVTAAGGRLPERQVERYAALGERDGWELYVMYGQTEATARMAYLPPRLARSHPGAIGVPIPGGSCTSIRSPTAARAPPSSSTAART
jgi:acyl-coenzyme A synthetase/AMP-(fatty) acid ligase